MITTLLLAAATALTCPPPADSSVTGFWESEEVSRGGIGHVFEFRPNGHAISLVTVMVDFAYRTSDGKLFIADTSDALKSQTNGTAYTIKGDTLLLNDGRGHEIKKTRLRNEGKQNESILGDWQSRHYTGGIAYERFTPEGHVVFRLPMNSQETCYTATSSTVTLNAPGGNKVMKFNVTGSSLILNDEQGRHYSYRRAKPWYPVDHVDYQPPKATPGV